MAGQNGLLLPKQSPCHPICHTLPNAAPDLHASRPPGHPDPEPASWQHRHRDACHCLPGVAQYDADASLTQFDALGHMRPLPHSRRIGSLWRSPPIVPVDGVGAKPANTRRRRLAGGHGHWWPALDLAPTNRYSCPTRGSMELFAEHFRRPLASIRLLSNRPVNSRWRRFRPPWLDVPAVADNPQSTRDGR